MFSSFLCYSNSSAACADSVPSGAHTEMKFQLAQHCEWKSCIFMKFNIYFNLSQWYRSGVELAVIMTSLWATFPGLSTVTAWACLCSAKCCCGMTLQPDSPPHQSGHESRSMEAPESAKRHLSRAVMSVHIKAFHWLLPSKLHSTYERELPAWLPSWTHQERSRLANSLTSTPSIIHRVPLTLTGWFTKHF